MLFMMISGPRQPGIGIVIYLSPLIEELRKLWDEWIDVFDGNRNETFKFLVMVFCTIYDFLA